MEQASRIEALTEAAGSHGMLAGQAVDLAHTGSLLDAPALEALHAAKTGALIRASVRIGALAGGGADEVMLERLDRYARCIGLTFLVDLNCRVLAPGPDF